MKLFTTVQLGAVVFFGLAGLVACADGNRPQHAQTSSPSMNDTSEAKATMDQADRYNLTRAQWRERLTDKQFRILRDRGTERAFANKFYDQKQAGLYRCAGCGLALFSSQDKFHSGTGWPSFTKPLDSKQVRKKNDTRGGMARTEVLCRRCGGHLGHIFHDGPAPTGLRYCVNSAAMTFEPMVSGKTNDKDPM